jgi:glutamate--cysteine ligase
VDQLLAPFHKGGVARPDRVIGTEYEVLIEDAAQGQTVAYDGQPGIFRLLDGMRQEFGWEPVLEKDKLIELRRDGKSITLEPGGQFEMSGAPLKTLRETQAELDAHVHELAVMAEHMPIRVHWLGMNPWQLPEDVRWMPKGRYSIMRGYMPTRGDRGTYMMGMTCTVQANLDYVDEADFARKFKLATGLGSLVTALFANSPILAGRPTGFMSYRAHIWTRTDPDRCGIPAFVFETDAGFEDYVRWALDVPMYFVTRDGEYVDRTGMGTFGELMHAEGPLEARVDDWELHLSTVFPDVRARPHLEMRTADCVPPELITACPALWKGLIYDESAADAAWDLIKALTMDERVAMAATAARQSIDGRRPRRAKGTLGDLCRDMLAIAREGLLRLRDEGLGEEGDEDFLDPLDQIIGTGRTPAHETLAAFSAK